MTGMSQRPPVKGVHPDHPVTEPPPLSGAGRCRRTVGDVMEIMMVVTFLLVLAYATFPSDLIR